MKIITVEVSRSVSGGGVFGDIASKQVSALVESFLPGMGLGDKVGSIVGDMMDSGKDFGSDMGTGAGATPAKAK